MAAKMAANIMLKLKIDPHLVFVASLCSEQ